MVASERSVIEVVSVVAATCVVDDGEVVVSVADVALDLVEEKSCD